MSKKPTKLTRAEVREREQAERQAYFREIEQRMSVSLSLLADVVAASRPKKSASTARKK